MDKYELFKQSVENISKQFLELPKRPVRIISHLDSDGLSSASILIKALKRKRIKFSVSIVRQLSETILKEIAEEEYKYIFFTDLGSGYLSLIKKMLPDKTIFILDHHKPENVKVNFFHLNPHLFDIDGSVEISGAGVVYLFCKALDEKNKDMAHIAIVGAIGDIQEDKGFKKLNEEILKDAIETEKIEIRTGLRMFGMQTKPIHKVLEYSTDPYIPSVTGNNSGAIKFLVDMGIDPKIGTRWKKLVNLDEEDMKKLVTGIILKRLGTEKKPEDVLGPIYILREEEPENPTRDAKEFSTLLNACGRLDKFSFGIGACLGNNNFRKKAIEVLTNYKKEIIDSLIWFSKNKQNMKSGENYIIINCENNVKDTMAGTLASMIAKSSSYKEGSVIISMANTLDDNVKISIRVAGLRNNEDLDLREVLYQITKDIKGAICGGHKFAAGSLIPQEKEGQFIESAEKVLKNLIIEEKVK